MSIKHNSYPMVQLSPQHTNDQQKSQSFKFLNLGNSNKKANTQDNSFEHSNSSFIDNQEEEKKQEGSRGYFKSSTMNENPNPYRIERSKFGIEICDLSQVQSDEVKRTVNDGCDIVLNEGNLKGHLGFGKADQKSILSGVESPLRSSGGFSSNNSS
jgi:hypothetical protein